MSNARIREAVDDLTFKDVRSRLGLAVRRHRVLEIEQQGVGTGLPRSRQLAGLGSRHEQQRASQSRGAGHLFLVSS